MCRIFWHVFSVPARNQGRSSAIHMNNAESNLDDGYIDLSEAIQHFCTFIVSKFAENFN